MVFPGQTRERGIDDRLADGRMRWEKGEIWTNLTKESLQ